MIIFKCKMCGGDLEIDEKMVVGTCQHCGSTMTLPKAADERITNLFNRANFYRRSSEFDKAIKVYENILNEDNTSAEAHWGLVLCKYGIEYVEDPATGQRIPTCHRTQKISIFLDVDYQQAIEYADETARALYKAEATTIDAIQKQILAISEQEEPYDIFICYKETSETGSRTKDSVLAQDIYFSLTEQGYKVFFSKITLEDKLGTAYEPYIFAALNSSQVMIVVATSAEHVSAVWTKNEWSRYLALINKGEKKVLIPVYRDMDPYELPEEFSHLQALDMSKLGFIQDLTRGVKKILDEGRKTDKAEAETSKNNNASGGAQPLIMRAFLCIEDGDFTKADDLLEQALNLEPMSAKAYIGKLMVELQLKDETALAAQAEPISEHNNYQKALRFAQGDYKTAVEGYNQAILDRIEAERQAAELLRQEALYKETVEKADLYENTKQQTETKYKAYVETFRSINGFKDAAELAKVCNRLAEKAAEDERIEQARLKAMNRKIAFIGTPVMVVAILFYLLIANYLIPLSNYNKAVALMENEQFEEAAEAFRLLGSYKDAEVMITEAQYQQAMKYYEGKQYPKSLELFLSLDEYKNSKAMSVEVNEARQAHLEEKFLESGNKNYSTTIAGGTSHTVGLQADGTVGAVGSNANGQLDVADWLDIVAVAAGYRYTVGLQADGTVVAVGSNANGQLDVTDWRDIVAVSAGNTHTVGLQADGTVVAVGNNSSGELNVADWTHIITVVAGTLHTVGLQADGTVVALGSDVNGQLNVADWSYIVAIAAGSVHTVGLQADGTVVAVGSNRSGQLAVADWSDIVAVTAGDWHTVGLKADGTVVAVGSNAHGQLNVSDWRDIVAVSAGNTHTVGLQADGTVVAVGSIADGQLDVSEWANMAVSPR